MQLAREENTLKSNCLRIIKGRLKIEFQTAFGFFITSFVSSETIVHAQGKLAAALVEGYASVAVGEALAVRTVLLVADVVDGEVDVQVVFFQRLPVGVDVVYAVA